MTGHSPSTSPSKQHNSHDDLWLLIDGKVYNVSKFLDEVRSDSQGGATALNDDG